MSKMFTWMKQSQLSLLLALIVAVGLLVGGCGGGGSDSYDTPRNTDTTPIKGSATDVLVDVATLKSWIDSGRINDDTGFDSKVVILDFNAFDTEDETKANYIYSPRIQGACRVNKAELDALRFEGVGLAAPLVPTGEQMDAVIQRLGIDDETTIVFATSSSSTFYSTRAYWIFRYWGFPKERLKLLDGDQAAVAAAYPGLMTTEAPTPEPSTYSVRNLPSLNDDLRASIGEFIEIIKTDLTTSKDDLVIDARGNTFYLGNGATGGQVGGDVVVVDGHPEGGQFLSQGELFESGKFKSAEEIKALFVGKGWEPGKKVTVYCTTGYSATPLFFALDAMLDIPVQLHDGSWSQTGKYSSFANGDGELATSSPWAIDRFLDPENYTYNKGMYPGPLTIETLNTAAAVAPQDAPFTGDVDGDSDVVQSQVEAADSAYADGTGTTNYLAPALTDLTNTASVLIDATTLKTWMDAGLVNAPFGSERVVILDVTTAADYVAKRHIRGAQLWNIAGQAMTRTEGPAPAVNMVLDGASMDKRIKAAGIDEHTTIVITSSATETYFPSRAYFTLRYWGIPKERIKVLNGYNNAWPQADLTATVPTITPSTLSVADLTAGAQLNTRVSLAELMDAVRDGRGIAVDMRGDSSATKSTAGVFGDVANDYVVFEGTLNGGTALSWKQFNVDYAAGDLRFKDAAAIETLLLNEAGVDGSEVVYSYCRTGYIAAAGFFVLDAILGWDVMTYDGSWSQWGKMSTVTTNKGGELPAGSAWATDTAEYMELPINYNKEHIKVVEPLNPDEDALKLSPADANQVEDADEVYQSTPPADSGSTGSSAPTAGGDFQGPLC